MSRIDDPAPHDDAAEQAVLGAILLAARVPADVTETGLQPD